MVSILQLNIIGNWWQNATKMERRRLLKKAGITNIYVASENWLSLDQRTIEQIANAYLMMAFENELKRTSAHISKMRRKYKHHK